jgi:hypothetical protein
MTIPSFLEPLSAFVDTPRTTLPTARDSYNFLQEYLSQCQEAPNLSELHEICQSKIKQINQQTPLYQRIMRVLFGIFGYKSASDKKIEIVKSIDREIFQKQLASVEESRHRTIQELQIDPARIINSDIAYIVQNVALPLYKTPFPRIASRIDSKGRRVVLSTQSKSDYQSYLQGVQGKHKTARSVHGSMHAARVVLWTQVLHKFYEELKRAPLDIHPGLLALSAAFHDVARENDGPDYWDAQSAQALEVFCQSLGFNLASCKPYIHAIEEKDPKNWEFTSDIQRIVHDADCLDILRVVGAYRFKPSFLCFYNFQLDHCDLKRAHDLIAEVTAFINLTEQSALQIQLEHASTDFYGELKQLISDNASSYPIIHQLLNR